MVWNADNAPFDYNDPESWDSEGNRNHQAEQNLKESEDSNDAKEFNLRDP